MHPFGRIACRGSRWVPRQTFVRRIHPRNFVRMRGDISCQFGENKIVDDARLLVGRGFAEPRIELKRMAGGAVPLIVDRGHCGPARRLMTVRALQIGWPPWTAQSGLEMHAVVEPDGAGIGGTEPQYRKL